MRAWIAKSFGGFDGLELGEAPVPRPAPGEALVRVRVAGVVTFDWWILHGTLDPVFPPITAPLILGNQGMGEIVDPGTTGFHEGERVMFAHFAYGFARPGCWAEYLCVEGDHLGRVPDDMSDEVAANLPTGFVTAYLALEAAGFAVGKSVLTTGIGGSVGNAAYQLARALGASKVFSTAGSTAKAEAARVLGYPGILDLSRGPMGDELRRVNGGENVDIVIETIGGEVTRQALACVNRQGTVITLGFTAGNDCTISLLQLILMSSRLEGFGVYSRTPEQWRRAYDHVGRLCSEGRIEPLTDRTFGFEQAPAALTHLVKERPLGTVALNVWTGGGSR